MILFKNKYKIGLNEVTYRQKYNGLKYMFQEISLDWNEKI